MGSYYTTREMDSLRIKNRRTWHRYSEGTGGDAIDFLQHFEGKSFPEAVEFLLAWNRRSRDSPDRLPPTQRKERPAPAPEPVSFVLPPANEDQRRVTAYLKKRGIAPLVIRGFVEAGLLYEEAGHHNCVFVGRNRENTPVFAAQRGTYDKDGASFRGGVPGSDKDIGFYLPADSGTDRVHVFEAPIDLMSFCTLHREARSNAIALCGLYEGGLDRYLKDHPHLNHVVLCLDNDGPGQEATERLRAEYKGRGLKVSTRTPGKGKDWNDYLQTRGPPRERGR